MKKYPLNLLISLIAVISLITTNNSCKDNSTGSDDDSNNFLFRVVVKNSGGQAVQSLRVSVFNKPSNFGFSKIVKGESINKTASLSTIEFDLVKSCRVTLLVSELDGTIVQQPVTDELLQFGKYSVTLRVLDTTTAGTKIYKTVLTAIDDTTHAQLFKDSVFITLWQPDPLFSILGYTSGTGVVETSDSLLFPHLLILPVMVRTTETGDSVGILTLPDDIVITLADTANLQSEQFIRKVVKGKNEFELTWNPSSASASTNSFPPQQFSMAKVDTVIEPVVVPRQFRLYQNYPNPFN